ncbi:MAG: hypothetical protein AB7S70_00615 [Hyphomicrobium sp.]|uniref:hypothetical protein n=1 Tax=Hyphomicrobium sp. TaxID=82 RepID=UPI003D11B60F
MTEPTASIKGADGKLHDVPLPGPPGRRCAKESRPVVLASEDHALLKALLGKPDASEGTLVAILARLSAVQVVPLDRSGAIAAAGRPQAVAGHNLGRRGFMIQNLSDGALWFDTLAAAVAGAPSFRLAPGAIYETPAHAVPSGVISILGGTTGQAFAAREW